MLNGKNQYEARKFIIFANPIQEMTILAARKSAG